MAQALDQRLKMVIGEQTFTILELQRQLEEAQEKLKEQEKPEPSKLHAVE
jgi:hypothetical protein